MKDSILVKHGFSVLHVFNIFSYKSKEYPDCLYHVVKSQDSYYFRGKGRTIALIKDEQHLIKLKKEHNLK